MDCTISQQYKNTKIGVINDPILEFIDKIRLEYLNYKKEKEDIISALQKTNLNLTETINNLNDQLNETYGSQINTEKKRRKTNSFDDSDLDSGKLFGRVNLLDSNSDSALSKGSSIDLSSVLDKKKRPTITKTNLSDDSDIDTAKLISHINIQESGSASDKSIDSALNEALNDENIDSEMFFPPTQTTNLPTTPTKRNTSPLNNNKILSPITNLNQTPPINIETPPLLKKLQLPKRMKPLSHNKVLSTRNNENQKPINWMSKDQFNQKNKNKWNMSFRQPVKTGENNLNLSGEVIACSQDIRIKSKKDRSTKTNLKYTPKLRQAKLEFDLTIEKNQESNSLKNQDNETFCEDIVGASPTCTTNSITSKDSKLTRTLRKITRNKSDDDLYVFPMKKSSSTEAVAATTKPLDKPTTSSTITPTKNQIKFEPKTVQKDVLLKKQFFEHMLTEDSIKGLDTIIDDNSISNISKEDGTVKKMLEDDSSLFIIPSQPDDVIFVDDTDQYDYNLSTMDLLAEMMRDEKDTQPLLKRFEAEQIKSIQSTADNNKKSLSITPTPSTSRLQLPQNKNKQIDNDDIKLSDIFDDKNDFSTTTIQNQEKKGFHHDCDDCQKHRLYLISQNVPADEIEIRLRTCKRKQKLHHTPEGFWDPRFRQFPKDDPRNEVLIDYRFVNKKKEQK